MPIWFKTDETLPDISAVPTKPIPRNHALGRPFKTFAEGAVYSRYTGEPVGREEGWTRANIENIIHNFYREDCEGCRLDFEHMEDLVVGQVVGMFTREDAAGHLSLWVIPAYNKEGLNLVTSDRPLYSSPELRWGDLYSAATGEQLLPDLMEAVALTYHPAQSKTRISEVTLSDKESAMARKTTKLSKAPEKARKAAEEEHPDKEKEKADEAHSEAPDAPADDSPDQAHSDPEPSSDDEEGAGEDSDESAQSDSEADADEDEESLDEGEEDEAAHSEDEEDEEAAHSDADEDEEEAAHSDDEDEDEESAQAKDKKGKKLSDAQALRQAGYRLSSVTAELNAAKAHIAELSSKLSDSEASNQKLSGQVKSLKGKLFDVRAERAAEQLLSSGAITPKEKDAAIRAYKAEFSAPNPKELIFKPFTETFAARPANSAIDYSQLSHGEAPAEGDKLDQEVTRFSKLNNVPYHIALSEVLKTHTRKAAK